MSANSPASPAFLASLPQRSHRPCWRDLTASGKRYQLPGRASRAGFTNDRGCQRIRTPGRWPDRCACWDLGGTAGLFPHSGGECCPLAGGEGEPGAGGVFGVADGDPAGCRAGDLDAVAVGAAVAAFPPGGAG
jgi:hypothetical protein